MKKYNKKGFTLIEILAVIIILGVLMIVAIPSVTNHIDESRKNSYISTIKEITGGARNLIHDGSFKLNNSKTTYYIDTKCISTDSGYRSPYGEFDKSYVVVNATPDGHDYYWIGVDKSGTGIENFKKIDNLETEDLKSGLDSSKIEPNMGVDGREMVVVIGGEGCTKSAPVKAQNSNSNNPRVCPEVSSTIYWAGEIKNDIFKLIISDSPITDSSSDIFNGSFSGTDLFESPFDLPWQSLPYIYSINEVEVIGNVVPSTTAYWLAGVGYNAETFSANLENLNVCNVTNMSNMFERTGYSSSSWSLTGLNAWDTSNVTNVSNMFKQAGYFAEAIDLNFSGWDTSKIIDMSGMFNQMGINSQTWSVKGLNTWDTSSVTNTSLMFSNVGRNAELINLDLSGWNMSNITNATAMFSLTGEKAGAVILNLSSWDLHNLTQITDIFNQTGTNANILNLDLSNWNISQVTSLKNMFNIYGDGINELDIDMSNWNTSNVTDLSSMFSYLAMGASIFRLNLSNWDTSKVTNMNNMFRFAGMDALTWSITGLNTWDTSNVTGMNQIFEGAASKAYTINLDISSWNTSKVSQMNGFFWNFGNEAQVYNIIIPKTNGNGIENGPKALYGKNNYQPATPRNDKTFTLAE